MNKKLIPNTFWKNRSVLITGGTGFLGSYVVEQLLKKSANVTVLVRNRKNLGHIEHIKDSVRFFEGDCTDLHSSITACRNQSVVMNLAAKVGGIEYNRTHQASMLYTNLRIAQTMIEAARKAEVERFLVVSSACIYPKDAIVPTPESEGFRGEPEPTNGGYGWAKRMAEKLGIYYAQEYGMKVGIVRPYNAYGPRDHFDPQTSHVIPALIRRIVKGEDPLVVWGSGNQTRAFLYAEDLAYGLIEAIEKHPKPDPLNLGTNEEVSIKTLVDVLCTVIGKYPKILFDTSYPDGSQRRNSDNTKAKKYINYSARTPLKDGLQKTVQWYMVQ
jgi:GDP-L-fucose synthase